MATKQPTKAALLRKIERLEAQLEAVKRVERYGIEMKLQNVLDLSETLRVIEHAISSREAAPTSHERDEAINILARFAEGLTTHHYSGDCPSDESPKSRDPQCMVCWAIDAARAATPVAQGDALDAARYRLLRRGQRWSVIDGIGDTLRGDELDAAIDAAKPKPKAKKPAATATPRKTVKR